MSKTKNPIIRTEAEIEAQRMAEEAQRKARSPSEVSAEGGKSSLRMADAKTAKQKFIAVHFQFSLMQHCKLKFIKM